VVPKFDEGYNVSGIQILEFKHPSDDNDDELQIVGEYDLPNMEDSEYSICNHITQSYYKKFVNEETGQVTAILVDSSITEE
jgi:hypothetical protein